MGHLRHKSRPRFAFNMIEVQNPISVTVSGHRVSILASGDDSVVAECNLEDLIDEAVQPFPDLLTLEIRSQDGFGTYLFHELELTSKANGVHCRDRGGTS